jgi:hypothetical protein
MYNMFYVEIHKYDYDKGKSPFVISTDNIVSVSWSTSVSPPHGTAKVSLVLPMDQFSVVVPGDWIIIRDVSVRTVFFGRISTVEDSISVRGGAVVSNLSLSAISWLDSLNNSEVFAPEGALDESVGTLFTKQDWAQTTVSFFQNYVFGQVGEALQILWRKIARVKLPASLGGKWLGDVVPVIYDDDTREVWAPDVVVEPLPQAGSLPTQLSFWSVRARAYDLLRGLFVPEPALIEMFPHLAPEPSDFTKARFERANILLEQGRGLPVSPPELPMSTPTGVPQDASGSDYAPVSVKDIVDFQTILGSSPVIIYRIRPWRSRPLIESVYASPTELAQVMSLPQAGSSGPIEEAKNDPSVQTTVGSNTDELLRGAFNRVTWNPKYFVKIPPSLVTSINRSRDDSNRLNCSTINLVISQIEALSASGLPVKNPEDIKGYGLRTMQATWPFIIRPSEDSKLVPFLIYMRAIAVQIMQFHAQGHRLGNGSVECVSAARVSFDDSGVEVAVGKAPAPQVVPVIEGRPFYIPLPKEAGSFTAYCESVQRSVSVQGSTLSSRTSIVYSRGLYSYEEDKRESNVVLPPVTLPSHNPLPGSQTGSGPQPPVASSATEVRPTEDFADSCEQGVPYQGGWPGRLGDLSGQYWLRKWALSRIVSSKERGKISGLWDAEKALSPAGKEIVRVLMDDDDQLYMDATVYEMHHNVVVIAAAAYVIEKFWRIKDKGATVRITSWNYARDGSTHSRASAIDFFVKLSDGSIVPALQSWLALSILAKEKRIPLGGRGLYLNVNPGTGIKGISADQAGQASANKSSSPPGSSSSTHYDVRGAFGVYSYQRKGSSFKAVYQPYAWVGMDWTGDGKDELTSKASITANDVLSLVADPERRLIDSRSDAPGATFETGGSAAGDDPNFVGPTPSRRRSRLLEIPRVNAMMYKQDPDNPFSPRISWKENDPDRLRLRDDLRRYIWNSLTMKRGDPPVEDPYLPKVDATVPNVMQVLGITEWCAVGSPTNEIAGSKVLFDKEIGMFFPARSNNAPLIIAFSGDSMAESVENLSIWTEMSGPRTRRRVPGQGPNAPDVYVDVGGTSDEEIVKLKAEAAKTAADGEPGGRIMLRALSPLIGKCHLFVSSNASVNGSKIYNFIKKGADQSGISNIDNLHQTLFGFSSGWKTMKQAYESHFSKTADYAFIVDFQAFQPVSFLFGESLTKKFKAASEVYWTDTKLGFGAAGPLYVSDIPSKFQQASAKVHVKDVPVWTPDSGTTLNVKPETELHLEALYRAADSLILGKQAVPTPPPPPRPQVQAQTDPGSEYGKFRAAVGHPTPYDNRRAPFISVFGGVDAGGQPSGVYMWKRFKGTVGELNNIFVAKNQNVDGLKASDWAYRQGVLPTMRPEYVLLMAYSAGGKPLKQFIARDLGLYDKIYLADVWMANEDYRKFYTKLVAQYPHKFVYIYSKNVNENAESKRAFNEIMATSVERIDGEVHRYCPSVAVDHMIENELLKGKREPINL